MSILERKLGNKDYLYIAILVSVTLIINIVLLKHLGLRYGGDSPRYLDGADQWLKGMPLSGRQYVYIGYIWLCALNKWIGLDIFYVYLFQVSMSILASVAAYFLGKKYLDEKAGFVCGLIWAISADVHFWNFYILTDSLYISFVMLSLCFVLHSQKGSYLILLLSSLSIFIMALIRANGFVFGLFLLISQMIMISCIRKKIIVAMSIIILILLPSSPISSLFLPITGQKDTLVMFILGFMKEGQISWPTITMVMPEQVIETGYAILDIFYYIIFNFSSVAKLWALRIFHFLFSYNPAFSTLHIIAYFLIFTVMHAGFVIGVFFVLKSGMKSLLIPLGIVIMHTLFVMITTNDYDGRYILYMRPAEIPFLSLAITLFFRWIMQTENWMWIFKGKEKIR